MTPTEVLDKLDALAAKATLPHATGDFDECPACEALAAYRRALDPATVRAITAAVRTAIAMRGTHTGCVAYEARHAFDEAIAALCAP